VRTGESLEGGINRNSSSQAITAVRDIYDRFLAKFPLLFGYWKKYADLEFSIAGTEAAEMVRLAQSRRRGMTLNNRTRSTNVESPASRIRWICGPTIAPSKLRPATIPMSFESKYHTEIPSPDLSAARPNTDKIDSMVRPARLVRWSFANTLRLASYEDHQARLLCFLEQAPQHVGACPAGPCCN